MDTTIATEPRLTGRRATEPWKIASSIFAPRMAVGRCSPNTQRMASLMLDFPHPFGPTMAVIPSWNSIWVESAKDLNPWTRSAFSFMADR